MKAFQQTSEFCSNQLLLCF